MSRRNRTSLKSQKKLQKITTSEKKQLRYYCELSFLPSTVLEMSEDVPEDLTLVIVSGWLSGKILSARPSYMAFVLKACQKLENHPQRPIVIDDKAFATLLNEKERTGIGGALLKHQTGTPSGLNGSKVNNWLCGKVKNVRKDHLDYVLAVYKALPSRGPRVALTPEMVVALNSHLERTGVGASSLLRGKHREIPDKLRSDLIMRWVKGVDKTARKDHFDYVLNLYKALPDQGCRAKTAKDVAPYGKITLIPDILDRIKAHGQRTGVDEKALLKGDKDKPNGLTSLTILHWLRGKCETAPKDHLKYVLKKWDGIPDLPQPYKVVKPKKALLDSYIDIPKDIMEQLQHYRALKFIPTTALELIGDVPEGLSVGMVSGWLTGQSCRALPSFLTFVLGACRKLESHPQRPVIVDDKIVAEFTRYREESDIGSRVLLKGRKDIPPGLSPSTINRWISGDATTARKDYLTYVRRHYRKIIKAQSAAE